MGDHPSRLAILACSGLFAASLGCGPSAPVPPAQATSGGLGTLSVSGSGRESYSLRDAAGNHITSVATGTKKELAAGEYSVALGNVAKVQVQAGEVTSFAIGTLAVSGTGKEGYSLLDSAGNHVTTVQASTEKELVPGDYSVALGNVAQVVVKGGERTQLALGVLVAGSSGGRGIGLSDAKGAHVTTLTAGEPKELVPGGYTLRIGEEDVPVQVNAGQTTAHQQ